MDIRPIDVYLMPPTSFHRHPARALSTTSLERSVLAYYGVVYVIRWTRPVFVRYRDRDLDANGLYGMDAMPTLRLAIQLIVEWPNVADRGPWTPFLAYADKRADDLYALYRQCRSTTHIPTCHRPIAVPPFIRCLVCRRERLLPSCGHSVCAICCHAMRVTTCPFCTHPMQPRDDISVTTKTTNALTDRLRAVIEDYHSTPFRFDWSNGNIRLYGATRYKKITGSSKYE